MAGSDGATTLVKAERRAATPIAGAVAGMLFAVLFGFAVVVIRSTMSDVDHPSGDWLHGCAGQFRFAISLVPFAGLFFLWFIAVNVYALRMAAVFLISQATLCLRTGVMPRWMAFVTYAIALVLLFIVTQSYWVILIFPGWVFLVSGYILVTHLSGRVPRDAAVPGEQGSAPAAP